MQGVRAAAQSLRAGLQLTACLINASHAAGKIPHAVCQGGNGILQSQKIIRVLGQIGQIDIHGIRQTGHLYRTQFHMAAFGTNGIMRVFPRQGGKSDECGFALTGNHTALRLHFFKAVGR